MNKSLRHKILFTCSDFKSIICHWIDAKQQEEPDFNRKKVSEKLLFSSHSTMYDFLNGRRPFPFKKIKMLKDVFNLVDEEVEYLELLYQLEKEVETKRCDEIYNQMRNIAQYLGFNNQFLSEQLKNSIFSMQVFTAFGLFNNKPSFDDLLVFFGRNRILDLEHAIHILYADGLIKREEERFVSNKLELVEISFKPSSLELLRESLKVASNDAENYVENPNAYFVSKLIPCKKENIAKSLVDFRKKLFKLTIKCEDKNGDVLVKLISGCYPTYK